MMCHEDFMKEALLLAKESAKEGEVPVGAVVVCDNKIVAKVPDAKRGCLCLFSFFSSGLLDEFQQRSKIL